MKKSMFILSGFVITVWCTGCMNTITVAHTPAEVIEIARSLATIPETSGCKVEEKVAGQQWVVTVDESIEWEKFMHHEISFHILALEPARTKVAVKAEVVYPFDVRRNARGVARRYYKNLGEELKKKDPDN